MPWAPDYVDLEELSAYMRVGDAIDDNQAIVAISAASRAVDHHCNRQFGLVATPEARYYTPWYNPEVKRWVVPIDDLMTATGLVVSADLDDSGDYVSLISEYALRPVNSLQRSRPWTSLYVLPASTVQPVSTEASVEVVARWGWTTVPLPVTQATLLQTSRFMARRESPFGIAGSPEFGNELRLLSKLDPDVAVALKDYVRPRSPR